MSELYAGGLENGLAAARWQLKWKDHAAIEEWANPQSTFWDAPVESACASDTASPDRVVFMIFSWTVTTQSDWRTKITQTVNNFRSKYSDLKRLDFMNLITGPNNMLCPTPPAAGETIVVSQELAAAMVEVAAAFPGFVYLSPKWAARSCSDFQGGGPHLTVAGNVAVAGAVSASLVWSMAEVIVAVLPSITVSPLLTVSTGTAADTNTARRIKPIAAIVSSSRSTGQGLRRVAPCFVISSSI